MWKKILILCFICTFLMKTAFAQEVTVDGFGVNRESAVRDAMRNAVEQVIGTYINAETLVENSILKLDELYSASRGFVNNVKILSAEKNSEGIWKILATMNVETEANTELIGKLETIMRLNDPRIAVAMLKDNSKNIRDTLTETAINEKLIELGFSHVEDLNFLQGLDFDKIYSTGNLSSKIDTDYLVVGKTHASSHNVKIPDYQNGGYIEHPLNVGNVDITVKIVKVKSGEIIETFKVSGKSNGNIADTAEQNAIKKAAAVAANELENRFKKVAMKVSADGKFIYKN